MASQIQGLHWMRFYLLLIAIVLNQPIKIKTANLSFLPYNVQPPYQQPTAIYCRDIRRQFTEGVLSLPVYLNRIKICSEENNWVSPTANNNVHLLQQRQNLNLLQQQQQQQQPLLRQRNVQQLQYLQRTPQQPSQPWTTKLQQYPLYQRHLVPQQQNIYYNNQQQQPVVRSPSSPLQTLQPAVRSQLTKLPPQLINNQHNFNGQAPTTGSMKQTVIIPKHKMQMLNHDISFQGPAKKPPARNSQQPLVKQNPFLQKQIVKSPQLQQKLLPTQTKTAQLKPQKQTLKFAQLLPWSKPISKVKLQKQLPNTTQLKPSIQLTQVNSQIKSVNPAGKLKPLINLVNQQTIQKPLSASPLRSQKQLDKAGNTLHFAKPKPVQQQRPFVDTTKNNNKLGATVEQKNKNDIDLTNALQTLLLTDQRGPSIYGPNYVPAQSTYNTRMTPYYYVPYPWWTAFNAGNNKAKVKDKIKPESETAFTIPLDFASRIRKEYITTASKIKPNQTDNENDSKEIRSFLRKQKSDTSLFQEENAVEEKSESDNEHLLTLKDYEDFISHPQNKTLDSFVEDGDVADEEDQTGNVRSLDNIIDGDDDDDVIAAATNIKARQTAKAAFQKSNNALIRNHMLRRQESLRKLEHDKLIERYARPPANPIEYLSEIFDELDTDTANAETRGLIADTGETRNQESIVNTQNQTSSKDLLKNDLQNLNLLQQNGSQNIETATSLRNQNRTVDFHQENKQFPPHNVTAINDADSDLLASVFSELNPTGPNIKTVPSAKVKRSPIVNVDLEGWFRSPNKLKSPPVNNLERQTSVKRSQLYPLGDIADLALLVNNKRGTIPHKVAAIKRTSIQMPTTNKRMTYMDVKSLLNQVADPSIGQRTNFRSQRSLNDTRRVKRSQELLGQRTNFRSQRSLNDTRRVKRSQELLGQRTNFTSQRSLNDTRRAKRSQEPAIDLMNQRTNVKSERSLSILESLVSSSSRQRTKVMNGRSLSKDTTTSKPIIQGDILKSSLKNIHQKQKYSEELIDKSKTRVKLK